MPTHLPTIAAQQRIWPIGPHWPLVYTLGDTLAETTGDRFGETLGDIETKAPNGTLADTQTETDATTLDDVEADAFNKSLVKILAEA